MGRIYLHCHYDFASSSGFLFVFYLVLDQQIKVMRDKTVKTAKATLSNEVNLLMFSNPHQKQIVNMISRESFRQNPVKMEFSLVQEHHSYS